MFTRPMFETADMIEQHELLDEAATLVEKGTLRTTMTQSFGALNATNLRAAHAAVERGDMIGKGTLAIS
jgi:NADPH:quinone reductase-like Zn-dependent oxidoreductase